MSSKGSGDLLALGRTSLSGLLLCRRTRDESDLVLFELTVSTERE